MRPALGHPALHAATGVGSLFALTWPLLVFDRPLYVFLAFFAIWSAMIALLFVFSRAQGSDHEVESMGAMDSEDPDARGD
jgi:hypothetical protein